MLLIENGPPSPGSPALVEGSSRNREEQESIKVLFGAAYRPKKGFKYNFPAIRACTGCWSRCGG